MEIPAKPTSPTPHQTEASSAFGAFTADADSRSRDFPLFTPRPEGFAAESPTGLFAPPFPPADVLGVAAAAPEPCPPPEVSALPPLPGPVPVAPSLPGAVPGPEAEGASEPAGATGTAEGPGGGAAAGAVLGAVPGAVPGVVCPDPPPVPAAVGLGAGLVGAGSGVFCAGGQSSDMTQLSSGAGPVSGTRVGTRLMAAPTGAEHEMAALDAGIPADETSITPSALAATPRRRPPWKPVIVLKTLNLGLTIVLHSNQSGL